jgi:arsenate reductase
MLFKTLKEVISKLDTSTVSKERQEVLNPLVNYISAKVEADQAIRLNFICTHNSRRSHLSQIWAQAMAAYFNINNVSCYSGGTEATAMFPKVGETLVQQGFRILNLSKGENPIYAIKYGDNAAPVIAFSKQFGDAFNPASEFAAILTCSSADEGCPVVLGCDLRVPVTYEDPKKSDGTPEQTETYFNRSLEIATEMKFVFSAVGNR